MITHCTGT